MQIKRGTPDSWTRTNPILEDGQLGFERLLTVEGVEAGDVCTFHRLYLDKEMSSYIDTTDILYFENNILISDTLVKVNNHKTGTEELTGYVDIRSINKTAVGSPFFRLKIGDGITHWNDLPYIINV